MFMTRKKHEFLSSEYVWLWAALAFQAGFANAGGFLACARYVSHMTGFGTQVGISLSQLNYDLAFDMISAPAAFLFGAMVSAMAVDRPMIQGKKPQHLVIMIGIISIFLVVTVGGISGIFGEFGEPLLLERDFILMSLLCFVCGMQNACFGSLTRGQIRTTHLTGILTDIGVTFVKLFYLEKKHRQTKLLKRVNYIRSITFLSFSIGSAISAILFRKLAFLGFGCLVVFSSVLFICMLLKERGLEKLISRRSAYNWGQAQSQANET